MSEQSVNATGIRSNSAALRLKTGSEMLSRASNLLQRLEEDDEVARVTAQAENAAAASEPAAATSTGNESQESSFDAGSMEVDADDPASLGRMIAQVASAASQAAMMSSMRAMQNQNQGFGGAVPPGQGSTGTPSGGGNGNVSAGVQEGSGEQAPQTNSASASRRAE